MPDSKLVEKLGFRLEGDEIIWNFGLRELATLNEQRLWNLCLELSAENEKYQEAFGKDECLCFWCGVRFPFPRKGTPEERASALTDHTMTCQQHPIYAASAENLRLKAMLAEKEKKA